MDDDADLYEIDGVFRMAVMAWRLRDSTLDNPAYAASLFAERAARRVERMTSPSLPGRTRWSAPTTR